MRQRTASLSNYLCATESRWVVERPQNTLTRKSGGPYDTQFSYVWARTCESPQRSGPAGMCRSAMRSRTLGKADAWPCKYPSSRNRRVAEDEGRSKRRRRGLSVKNILINLCAPIFAVERLQASITARTIIKAFGYVCAVRGPSITRSDIRIRLRYRNQTTNESSQSCMCHWLCICACHRV